MGSRGEYVILSLGACRKESREQPGTDQLRLTLAESADN